MIFTNEKEKMRFMFIDAWIRFKNKQELSSLEIQISNIILQHPEYHEIMSNKDNIYKDYFPEQGDTNPFLHLSLHLGIHEQVATNRPLTITNIYKKLLNKYQDQHKVDHIVMEYLAEIMMKPPTSLAENAMIEKKYLIALQQYL